MEVGFYLLLDFFRFLFDILAECLVFVCLELGDDAVDHGWWEHAVLLEHLTLLLQAVVADGTLNYAAYAAQLGVSEATVKRRLGELKTDGIIIRVGSNKTGHWEVAKQK